MVNRSKLTAAVVSALATVCVASCASEAGAQACPHVYCPSRPAAVVGGRAYYHPVYTVPAAPMPAAAPAPPAHAQGDGPGVFLALLNAERARHGRGPLAWSDRLAAYASLNTATHAPGSSGGAGQCWAGVSNYSQAFAMWRASGPHWAILLNATTEVGVSPCPTGMTANAR